MPRTPVVLSQPHTFPPGSPRPDPDGHRDRDASSLRLPFVPACLCAFVPRLCHPQKLARWRPAALYENGAPVARKSLQEKHEMRNYQTKPSRFSSSPTSRHPSTQHSELRTDNSRVAHATRGAERRRDPLDGWPHRPVENSFFGALHRAARPAILAPGVRDRDDGSLSVSIRS